MRITTPAAAPVDQALASGLAESPAPRATVAPVSTPRATRLFACRRHRGFTMIELIVTLILIGILAAVAIPRMNLINSFDEVGYRD